MVPVFLGVFAWLAIGYLVMVACLGRDARLPSYNFGLLLIVLWPLTIVLCLVRDRELRRLREQVLIVAEEQDEEEEEDGPDPPEDAAGRDG